MPLDYAVAVEISPSPKAKRVQNTGINIRLPLTGEATVTFYFSALDAASKVVEDRPLTLKIDDLKIKYPGEFATVYGMLKRIAYKEAQETGLYPVGTVS